MKEELFTIEMRLDFGSVGHQSVTIIGVAWDCGVSVTEIASRIVKVTVHVLRADLSDTDSFVITHLIDNSAKQTIHEKIEERYRLVKSHEDAAPIFDFDNQEGA